MPREWEGYLFGVVTLNWIVKFSDVCTTIKMKLAWKYEAVIDLYEKNKSFFLL